jgi:hypothetical protein
MTISSTTRKTSPYVGDDSTDTFAFAFKVFAASDVYVVIQGTETGSETILDLDVDYTVTLNANQNTNPGGEITLTTALADGETMVISSDVQPLQTTDITNLGGFYPSVITNALDKLTVLVQQLIERFSRSMSLPITTPTNVSAELPLPDAGKALVWKDDETGLKNAGIVSSGELVVSTFGESLVNVGDAAEAQDLLLLDYQNTCGGRLSLDSTPGNSGDLTAQTSIYLVAYVSDRIGLFDGTRWISKRFNPSPLVSGSRVAVPSTANTNFDVFAYIDGSNQVRLETVNWASDTARATAIERYGNVLNLGGGCYVKSGDPTRRYLGTGRTTGVSGQCEDSQANRFLWNLYNQIPRKIEKFSATGSWTYSTATHRIAEGASNYVRAVCGAPSDTNNPSAFDVTVRGYALNSDSTNQLCSIAVHAGSADPTSAAASYDSQSTGWAYTDNVYQRTIATRCVGTLVRGLNYLAPLEWSQAGGTGDTTTWYGSSQHSGIQGFIVM